jgi:hypothetical protein
LGGTSIQCLSPEDPTEGTVIRQPNDFDDLIHAPAIQLLVAEYGEWEFVRLLVVLDGLEGVVPVARDSLIDGEEVELESVIVLPIEVREDVRQDGGVLATRCGDRDLLALMEELVRDYGMVNLGFECYVETLLTDEVPCLWTDDECLSYLATLAILYHRFNLIIIWNSFFNLINYILDEQHEL